mgnify:CR=1 FL=1
MNIFAMIILLFTIFIGIGIFVKWQQIKINYWKKKFINSEEEKIIEDIMNKNIYIISDVHGCYKSLKALINQFPNKENSKIVFVGDLIDRGASSCEVVKFIMDNT